MNRHIVFRILAGVVLLAAIPGIAFFAFNAGMARGAVTQVQLPAGQNGSLPVPYYGWGLWHPFPFFGLGCFGVLIPLFLLFLVFGAFRRLIWGPGWGWRHMGGHNPMHGPMHMHGHWAEKDAEGVPPVFSEWHRKAHEGSHEESGEDTQAK